MRHNVDPIARQMRVARERRGWSLEKAGEELGMPAVVIGSYERGDRHPPLENLRRWVEAMGYRLQVVGPESATVAGYGDAVGSDGSTWLEFAVECADERIVCAGREDADRIAAVVPGANVVERQVYASPWRPAAELAALDEQIEAVS